MSHIEFSRTAPDGQELFYQGWLPQDDPRAAVCLLHGLGEHSGRYAHVGRALKIFYNLAPNVVLPSFRRSRSCSSTAYATG